MRVSIKQDTGIEHVNICISEKPVIVQKSFEICMVTGFF